MPRGGHKGAWFPTPSDIYKSRWKIFFKRNYRPRSGGNFPDNPRPHLMGRNDHDFVPAPWKLHMQLAAGQGLPPAFRRDAFFLHLDNSRTYMNPVTLAQNPIGRDCIVRCLDAGRRGTESGVGRAEIMPSTQTLAMSDEAALVKEEIMPTHVQKALRDSAVHTGQQQFYRDLEKALEETESFNVRRLYELCEEKEIRWPRPPRPRRQIGEHGIFPYVEEKGSLVNNLFLNQITRLRHRTRRRKLPKWIAIESQMKHNHQQYLRRRQMLSDEAQARFGVMRKAMET